MAAPCLPVDNLLVYPEEALLEEFHNLSSPEAFCEQDPKQQCSHNCKFETLIRTFIAFYSLLQKSEQGKLSKSSQQKADPDAQAKTACENEEPQQSPSQGSGRRSEPGAEASVDAATQSNTEACVDSAAQCDDEDSVDPGTQSFAKAFADSATQSNNEVFVVSATQYITVACIDSATQSDVEASVDSATQSDVEASVDAATQYNTEACVDSAAQSDVEASVVSATQSDVEASVDSATQSDVKASVDSATQSDVEASVDSATQSDVEASVDSATQSDVEASVDSATQSDVEASVDSVTQTDDAVDTLTQSDTIDTDVSVDASCPPEKCAGDVTQALLETATSEESESFLGTSTDAREPASTADLHKADAFPEEPAVSDAYGLGDKANQSGSFPVPSNMSETNADVDTMIQAHTPALFESGGCDDTPTQSERAASVTVAMSDIHYDPSDTPDQPESDVQSDKPMLSGTLTNSVSETTPSVFVSNEPTALPGPDAKAAKLRSSVGDFPETEDNGFQRQERRVRVLSDQSGKTIGPAGEAERQRKSPNSNVTAGAVKKKRHAFTGAAERRAQTDADNTTQTNHPDVWKPRQVTTDGKAVNAREATNATPPKSGAARNSSETDEQEPRNDHANSDEANFAEDVTGSEEGAETTATDNCERQTRGGSRGPTPPNVNVTSTEEGTFYDGGSPELLGRVRRLRPSSLPGAEPHRGAQLPCVEQHTGSSTSTDHLLAEILRSRQEQLRLRQSSSGPPATDHQSHAEDGVQLRPLYVVAGPSMRWVRARNDQAVMDLSTGRWLAVDESADVQGPRRRGQAREITNVGSISVFNDEDREQGFFGQLQPNTPETLRGTVSSLYWTEEQREGEVPDCVLCQSGPADTVLLNCQHTVVCRNCARGLWVCPLPRCRAFVICFFSTSIN